EPDPDARGKHARRAACFTSLFWPIADLPQWQAPPAVVKNTGASAKPCASGAGLCPKAPHLATAGVDQPLEQAVLLAVYPRKGVRKCLYHRSGRRPLHWSQSQLPDAPPPASARASRPTAASAQPSPGRKPEEHAAQWSRSSATDRCSRVRSSRSPRKALPTTALCGTAGAAASAGAGVGAAGAGAVAGGAGEHGG